MKSGERALDFSLLDDICLGVANGRLKAHEIPKVISRSLGPALEAYHLKNDFFDEKIGLEWLDAGSLTAVLSGLSASSSKSQRVGDNFGWIARSELSEVDEWNAFLMRAKRAAVGAGFTNSLAAKLVAAIDEFRANISEHSQRLETGYAAFQAENGVFEFVVADKGVGVLESLRTKADYSSLDDVGVALQLAMTEGVSRFPSSDGRGMGFRPLLVGLANIARFVRIRSGDHSRELERLESGAIPAVTTQRVPLTGLFCSVVCRAS